MSNPVWTERDRIVHRREMARQEDLIALFPNGRRVYGSRDGSLDYTPHERIAVVVAYLVIAAFIVALVLAPLAIGGVLISVLGL